MTNKDAIIWLRGIRDQFTGNCTTDTLVSISRCDIQAIDLAIKALEERPQGEWIKQYGKSYELKTNEGVLVGEFTKCPKCQYDKARGSNFCPNCGADMRGKEE